MYLIEKDMILYKCTTKVCSGIFMNEYVIIYIYILIKR